MPRTDIFKASLRWTGLCGVNINNYFYFVCLASDKNNHSCQNKTRPDVSNQDAGKENTFIPQSSCCVLRLFFTFCVPIHNVRKVNHVSHRQTGARGILKRTEAMGDGCHVRILGLLLSLLTKWNSFPLLSGWLGLWLFLATFVDKMTKSKDFLQMHELHHGESKCILKLVTASNVAFAVGDHSLAENWAL